MTFPADQSRPRPNLFIVGAPKCGTTSLFEYLRGNPAVFLPSRKEPHFFGSDLDMRSHGRVSSEREYLELFRDAGSARWIVDASTWYFWSTTAPREIHAFSPQARVVVCVRNPVDLLWSLHGQYVYSAREDILDFEQAIAAEPARRAGQRLVKGIAETQHLMYSERGRLFEPVQRYLNEFGKDRVFISVLDDLATNPGAVYERLLRFLEIEPADRPDLIVHNKGRWAIMPPWLRRSVRAAPIIRHAAKRAIPGQMKQWVGSVLKSAATRSAERTPVMAPQLRAQLQDLFRDDVRRLGELLDRDLSHWVTHDARLP
jgi:hypothetical protein